MRRYRTWMKYTESREERDSIKYDNSVIAVIVVKEEYIIVSFKKRRRIEVKLGFILLNCGHCINL